MGSLALHLQSAVKGWLAEQSEELRRKLESQSSFDLEAIAKDLEHLASQLRAAHKHLAASDGQDAVRLKPGGSAPTPVQKVSGLTMAQWNQLVVEAVGKTVDANTGLVRASAILRYVESKAKDRMTAYDRSLMYGNRSPVWAMRVYGVLRRLMRRRVLLPTNRRGTYRLSAAVKSKPSQATSTGASTHAPSGG